MSNAFSDALDAIYEDANAAVDALWKQGGAGGGVACRIIRPYYKGGAVGPLHLEARRAPHDLRVRKSEVVTVMAGDTFTITQDGAIYVVRQGDPDGENVEWRIQAERA